VGGDGGGGGGCSDVRSSQLAARSSFRQPLRAASSSRGTDRELGLRRRTEIIIRATRTQNVLGEKGRRIRELTSVVQKRFSFPEGSVELYAEKVANRGLCAVAQAESLRYKLVGGLAVRSRLIPHGLDSLRAYAMHEPPPNAPIRSHRCAARATVCCAS
jgi:hypothetical protein